MAASSTTRAGHQRGHAARQRVFFFTAVLPPVPVKKNRNSNLFNRRLKPYHIRWPLLLRWKVKRCCDFRDPIVWNKKEPISSKSNRRRSWNERKPKPHSMEGISMVEMPKPSFFCLLALFLSIPFQRKRPRTTDQLIRLPSSDDCDNHRGESWNRCGVASWRWGGNLFGPHRPPVPPPL